MNDIIVASTRIRRPIKHELFMKTKKAMGLAKWKNHVKGETFVIVADYSFKQVMPGLCTSPWLVESLIKILKEEFPFSKILFYASSKESMSAWKIDALCKSLGVTIIDKIEGFDSADIIAVPVARTDSQMTVYGSNALMTITLKNQPTTKIDLKPSFVVADATACFEGWGFYGGKPILLDAVIASSSPLALDSALCHMMGFDPRKVRHLSAQENSKKQSIHYRLIGDLPEDSFILPKRLPFFEKFHITFWYKIKGKKLAQNFILTSPLLEMQFGRLI